MSDHPDDHDETHEPDHHDETHGHDIEGLDRVTSPMQSYSMGQVGVGLAVLAVGLLVAFVFPLVVA